MPLNLKWNFFAKVIKRVRALWRLLKRDLGASALRSILTTLCVVSIVTVLIMIAVEISGGDERLQALVASAGSWAPVAFIALKASTYTLAPLSGLPLKIAAGTLFGLWEGTLYTLLGEAIGGSLNFWIARRLRRPVLTRLLRTEDLSRIDGMQRSLVGWRALLFARIFLSAVYDFVSYAAGLVHGITYRQYILVSVLGGLVSTTFWVTWGVAAAADGLMRALLLAGVTALAAICALVLWRLPKIGADSQHT